jgi:RNA-directed DNA polymerase
VSNVSVRVMSAASGTAMGLAVVQAQVYRQAQGPRPFAGLMAWVLDRRNLEAAWSRVRDADGADTPGLDGVTASVLRREGSAWLTVLAESLLQRRYVPSIPRWIEIPKPNKPGQTRRLGILNLCDRVVLSAIKQVLEPVLEPIFLDQSFGFRPGRSVPAALAEAAFRLTPRPGGDVAFSWAVHLDVADCFDTVDHSLLLAELGRPIADADLMRLIEKFLVAGGSTVRRYFRPRRQGLVQGSALSPLLCNLALHPLDLALRELGSAHKEGVLVLRYADDLLLLASDAALASKGVACVRGTLSQMHQKLRRPHDSPKPAAEGVDWLGVRIQPRALGWAGRIRFGYVVPDAKVTAMLERLTEMTAPPSDKIDGGAFNLARWIVSINEQLRDWRQAYQFTDNSHEVFRALDEHCHERVGALLQSVTGVRRASLHQFRARLPRGFRTWEVPGARLTVLSSLAPHWPANLVRQPAWVRAPAEDESQHAARKVPRLTAPPSTGPDPAAE